MSSAIITMEGHILDSLLLPKVLDLVVSASAEYEIEEIKIGRTQKDQSFARIRINTGDDEALAALLSEVQHHGAVVVE